MKPDDPISQHFRLIESQKKALKKLGLETIADLLYHFPARFERIDAIKSISSLQKGDEVSVFGTLSKLETRKTWHSRRAIAEGKFTDGTGTIKVMWFNQPYLAKMVPENVPVKLSGVIGGTEGKLYLANPEVEVGAEVPHGERDSLFVSDTSDESLYAIYPESRGITSKWFRHALEKVLKTGVYKELEDPIPEYIRKHYSLPELSVSLVFVHTPKKSRDFESAKKRFAFEEVFLIQLAKQMARNINDELPALAIRTSKKEVDAFMQERFQFEPTHAQRSAIDAILKDVSKPPAMSRLLEGDVGSGKTAVAAAASFAVIQTAPKDNKFGSLQVAYMCPTEILAKQHFAAFVELFSHLPIAIGLVTSSGCRKFPSKVDASRATDISKAQLLRWVESGEVSIVIGTHALIQKSVIFKNLGLVIIDEQHRFGTMQRKTLVRKDNIQPHLLSMTATPIPRTLALTLYGDLDLTVLDQMPKGRKPIITELVKSGAQASMYVKVREQLQEGKQAYVICPRIDEPDPTKLMALNAKSATEEAKRLKKEVFPEYAIGLVHSKLSSKEKDSVMQQFTDGAINILVSTSVVEVGVNVPNATVIIIEGAERFGLAQLHQLRGRVLRSSDQAYCFCVSDSKSKFSLERLKALKTAKNGFELAEFDLKLRGPGELYGRSQSGLSDIGMEALKNLKLVEAARDAARKLVEEKEALAKHPNLVALAQKKAERLHFE